MTLCNLINPDNARLKTICDDLEWFTFTLANGRLTRKYPRNSSDPLCRLE